MKNQEPNYSNYKVGGNVAKIENLTDVKQWESLWSSLKESNAPRLLVFKRSPTCPTSHFAERIFLNYVKTLPDNPALHIVSVDVIAARPVSQRIAADTKVQHESPQALLLGPVQKILWHDSHGEITEDALQEALAK
jgi:bacillithiol system protein YtxJ